MRCPGAAFVVNGAAQARDAALTTTYAAVKGLNGVSLPNGFTPTDILNDTIVPDPTNSGAWPIVGFTYADFYGCYKVAKTTKGITGYVKWMDSTTLPQGQSIADKAIIAGGLVYLPTKMKLATIKAMKGVLTGPIGGVCTL